MDNRAEMHEGGWEREDVSQERVWLWTGRRRRGEGGSMDKKTMRHQGVGRGIKLG